MTTDSSLLSPAEQLMTWVSAMIATALYLMAGIVAIAACMKQEDAASEISR